MVPKCTISQEGATEMSFAMLFCQCCEIIAMPFGLVSSVLFSNLLAASIEATGLPIECLVLTGVN